MNSKGDFALPLAATLAVAASFYVGAVQMTASREARTRYEMISEGQGVLDAEIAALHGYYLFKSGGLAPSAEKTEAALKFSTPASAATSAAAGPGASSPTLATAGVQAKAAIESHTTNDLASEAVKETRSLAGRAAEHLSFAQALQLRRVKSLLPATDSAGAIATGTPLCGEAALSANRASRTCLVFTNKSAGGGPPPPPPPSGPVAAPAVALACGNIPPNACDTRPPGAEIDCDLVASSTLPISNAAALQAMVSGGFYRLENDIDMSSVTSLNLTRVYLDGNNHRLLNIRRPIAADFHESWLKNVEIVLASDYDPNSPTCADPYSGEDSACSHETSLLGPATNSCVQNLVLRGGTIERKYVGKDVYYGGGGTLFAYLAQTTVRNLTFNANLKIAPLVGSKRTFIQHVSGLGGAVCSQLEDIHMNGDVELVCGAHCGASGVTGLFAGLEHSKLSQATFAGNIFMRGKESSYTGVAGIVMGTCRTDVRELKASGNITVEGRASNFGLLGNLFVGHDLEANGTIKIAPDAPYPESFGLLGGNLSNVSKVKVTGSMSVNPAAYHFALGGGFVGWGLTEPLIVNGRIELNGFNPDNCAISTTSPSYEGAICGKVGANDAAMLAPSMDSKTLPPTVDVTYVR